MPTPTNPTGSNEGAALPGVVKIDNNPLTGSDSDWYIAAYNVSDECIGTGTIITSSGVNYIVNLAINKPSSTDLTFTVKLGNTVSNTTYSHANSFTWSNQNGGDLPGYTVSSEFNFTQDTGGGGGGTVTVPTATNPTGSNEGAALPGVVKIDNNPLTGSDSDWYIAAYNVSDECIGTGTIITSSGVNYIVNLAINKPSSTDLTFTVKLGNTVSNTTYSHANSFTWSNQNGGDLPGYTVSSEFNFTQDTGGGGGADSEKPVIISGTTGTNLVENIGAGQTIYTITATDNVAVTGYAIAGTDASLLSVDPDSGVVTLLADPDYENKSSYSFDVTATDGTNTSDPVTVTFSISDANDPTTGIPGITSSGNTASPLVGDTLTATSGNIADQDDLGAFSYQWKNSSGATVIGTSSTYTIQQSDKDYTITVSVTFNDGGSNSVGPLTSSATGTVTAPNSPATGLPTITGTASEGGTLTANLGTITDTDGLPGPYTYQWKRDDSPIGGETSSTYTVASADVGKTITVTVSFTDNAENQESRTSAGTDIAALDELTYFWTEYFADASNNIPADSTLIHYGIYNTTKISGVQFTYDVAGTTSVADVSYSIVDNTNNDTMIHKKDWPIHIINNTTDVANKAMVFAGSVDQTINGMNTGVFAIVKGNVTLASIVAVVDNNSDLLATDQYALGEPANPPEITEPGGRKLGDINFDGVVDSTDEDILEAYLLNDSTSLFSVYDDGTTNNETTGKTAGDIITDMTEYDWKTYVDVNNNGEIDVGDLVRLLSKVADSTFSMTNGT